MSKLHRDLSIFPPKCINTPTCQTEVRKDSLPWLFVKHSLPTGDWQAYLYAGPLLQITGVETCFVSGLTEGESARKSLFGMSSAAFNCLLCCVCMGEEKLPPPPPSLRCIQYGHCAGNNKSKSLKIAWRYRKWWSHQEHVCCKWNGKCLKLQFVHVTNQLNKKHTPKRCKAVK